MGLKQSIVVVNEFTYKNQNGRGTRGSSPHDYVMGYMARGDAVEDVAPTKTHEGDLQGQVNEQRNVVAQESEDIPQLRRRVKSVKKKAGVAFCNDDAAMSDEKLRNWADFMQQAFEDGKTIFKTVLSFNLEWLREHGLIDEEFEAQKRGDFRGKVDQLKLRFAVMNGLRKMGRNFDDLRFVGTVQSDTKHLHVHLAMVDAGRGRLRPDGLQRGKLTDNDKIILRRGIDDYLDRKQMVKALSTSVLYDKRNTLCYVKRFTHQMLNRQGLPQFLLACLPDNRNLWRANSHNKDMRKANAIVRDYVQEVLAESDSGYLEAMDSVVRYADHRKQREDLSDKKYAQLVREGEDRIVKDCMNAVYAVLKKIPASQMQTHTQTLDMMSLDYETMASLSVNNPMIEFGFKLRSYSNRLSYHRKEYHKYRDEYRAYEEAENKVKDAEALGEYLRLERDYNAMLMTKYQYFLSFLPPDMDLEQEFQQVMKKRERLEKMRQLKEDVSLRRLTPAAAEEYGLKVYDCAGGNLLRTLPDVYDRRLALEEQEYQAMETSFRDKLRDAGLDYDGSKIVKKKMYSFDEVKALDLHHLGYDFPFEVRISKRNVDAFCDMADRRFESFQKARRYLMLSGQEDAVSILPEKDVLFMQQYADSIRPKNSMLMSNVNPASGGMRRRMTVDLGTDYATDLHNVIVSTVESVQLGEE